MRTRTVLWAGGLAAVFSGAPSTVIALATGNDPLEPTLAAGRMFRPDEQGRTRLVLAAGAIHLALSGWWTVVICAVLRRPTLAAGAGVGALIAAVDLGAAHVLPSRRLAAVRELPVLPQIADHLLFGALVAAGLRGQDRMVR